MTYMGITFYSNEELPDDLYMHKADSCYKHMHGLPEWYNFNAPCILAHPADSSSIKEEYSSWALRARRFTPGVELNVRIVASNNASTPKSNRIACLYYVEKDYLPFTAHWQEVRTYQGNLLSDFGTVDPGQRVLAQDSFKLILPENRDYYIIAQINDIENRLNPKPPSTRAIDLEKLHQSYLWSVLDTANPVYITG